eukprot:1157206-Pelagomonas_calceolata.AAC.6
MGNSIRQGKRRGCGFCCTWMTAVNGVLEPPHLLYLIITAMTRISQSRSKLEISSQRDPRSMTMSVFSTQYEHVNTLYAAQACQLPPAIQDISSLHAAWACQFPPRNLTHVLCWMLAHTFQRQMRPSAHAQGSTYFSPTRLASSLCGGSSGGDAQSTANADIAGGHIIVESNFKQNGTHACNASVL